MGNYGFSSEVKNFQIKDDYAFVFPSAVLDISEPTNIEEVFGISKKISPFKIVSDNYAISVTGVNSNFKPYSSPSVSLIDVSNPSSLKVLSSNSWNSDSSSNYWSVSTDVSATDKYIVFGGYFITCEILSGCLPITQKDKFFEIKENIDLEISSFNARIKGKGHKRKAVLKWKVKTEDNVKNYYVKRKKKLIKIIKSNNLIAAKKNIKPKYRFVDRKIGKKALNKYKLFVSDFNDERHFIKSFKFNKSYN